MPFHYLHESLSKGIVRRTGATQQLCKALEPIARLNTSHLPETCRVLHREGYDIICDTRTKVASYVYERLTTDSLRENAKREGHSFKVDRDVPPQNRAKQTDFTNSGYDRGHLRAAANAVSSEKAMADTFLLTNICPQEISLNRGYWKELEKYVRSLVNRYDVVETFTGPLFLPQVGPDGRMNVSYNVIGNGNVAVPTHFFKVLYLYNHPTTTHEAYILPNEPIPANTPLTTFLRTVYEVQQLSGILFSQSHFAI